MNGIIRKSRTGRILSEAGRVILILRREGPERYAVFGGSEDPLYTLSVEKNRFRIEKVGGQVLTAGVRSESCRYAPLPETVQLVTVPPEENPVLIRREGDGWRLERNRETVGSCRRRLFTFELDLKDDSLAEGGLIPGILMALTELSGPDAV